MTAIERIVVPIGRVLFAVFFIRSNRRAASSR
jgi:hypothetical protein